MWSPDRHNLNGQHDGSVFLLAAWNELFDPFTPDSFQPRLHNVASLVEEIGDISSRIADASIWWKHANKVRDELFRVAEEEQDVLNLLPEYQWQLERIRKTQDARDIHLTCRLLLQRRGEYERVLLESVRRSADGLPKEKHAAYKALRRLATLNVQASREDSDVLVTPEAVTEPPETILQSIIGTTLQSSQNYDCVFALIGSQRDIQQVLRAANFRLVRNNILPQEAVAEVRNAHHEVHFVQITVQARSTRDAISKGRRSLSIGIDVFDLYSNSAALQVADRVFFRLQGSDQFATLRQSEQAFRRLYPRSRAAQKSLETLEMVSQNRLEDRVLSALELHSLAIASSEPRIKLINLWSALESLAGCCEAESVIERVLTLIVPMLMWRRVDKVVRYTAIAVQQLGNIQQEWSYGSGFTRSHETFVHPWDMMLTLCRPKDHQDITELLAFCGRHPLLVFRVYRLWQQLSDPKELRRTLLLSRDRIVWQLWRIYRARNLVIHDGVEVPFLGTLLDNLQYYTSIVIQRIIHGMKLDPTWDVRQSLEYWNAKSCFILEALDKQPKVLRVSDFFPFEARSDAPHLW
jgi:hypothetical protein